MDAVRISVASETEKEWAATLMAETEPWITLGRDYEGCLEVCRRPAYEVYVSRLGREPCGLVVLVRYGVAGSPYIASIAVSESFRSRGIGARLLEFAENLYRPAARHIFLCVSSFNTRARAWYERCGYRSVGELEDYIIEGASEILMHKALRRP